MIPFSRSKTGFDGAPALLDLGCRHFAGDAPFCVEERLISLGAVPEGGRVVAALSVSGPVDRTTRHPGDRYGALVVEAATRVESRLA